MNIASVKFKGIENNIYTRTKQKIQQKKQLHENARIKFHQIQPFFYHL
mgnify:CR=1 FL=1